MDINIKLGVGEARALEEKLRNLLNEIPPTKENSVKITLQILENSGILVKRGKSSTSELTNADKKTLAKNRTTEILRSFGVNANLLGFQFIREAVVLSVEKPKLLKTLTKGLYPAVAQKFGTKVSNVERGIRHAIESSWYLSKGNSELKRISKNKPTNGDFLAYIVDEILNEFHQ